MININWLEVLYVYLAICGAVGLYWIVVCAYEDIFKGPDSKFGYNYKSGFSWLLFFFFACPVVNIATLGFTLFVAARKKASKYAKSV